MAVSRPPSPEKHGDHDGHLQSTFAQGQAATILFDSWEEFENANFCDEYIFRHCNKNKIKSVRFSASF